MPLTKSRVAGLASVYYVSCSLLSIMLATDDRDPMTHSEIESYLFYRCNIK